MAGGEELAEVACPAATVHQIIIRLLREREEVMANSSRGKTRPVEWPARRSVAAPWPVPPELTGKTLGTTFWHGRKLERERGEGGALTMAKIEDGVGSVCRIERGGSRWSPMVVLYAFEREQRHGEREQNREREGARARARSKGQALGGNVGEGVGVAAVAAFQREGRRRLLEVGGGTDGWVPLVSRWRERRGVRGAGGLSGVSGPA